METLEPQKNPMVRIIAIEMNKVPIYKPVVVSLLSSPGDSALDPAWMPGSDTGNLGSKCVTSHSHVAMANFIENNGDQAYHLNNHEDHG